MVAAALFLSACAGDRLAATPPAGVDLSGHWLLNDADSDNAQRLMQAQLTAATSTTGPGSTGSRGGRGGRDAGGGGFGAGGPTGPMMPAVTLLDEGLRWPGKDLAIKQTGETVVFTADGGSRACRSGEGKRPAHRGPPKNDPSHGRDAPARGRGDAPPPRCGWDSRTLVVQSSEPDEDRPPFEQRFSVSADGQRLFELVSFKGGRSSGFTASRVWDRAPTAGAPGSQQ